MEVREGSEGEGVFVIVKVASKKRIQSPITDAKMAKTHWTLQLCGRVCGPPPRRTPTAHTAHGCASAWCSFLARAVGEVCCA